jgi:hypothetical protein
MWPDPGRPQALLRQAALLNGRAYAAVVRDSAPFRRGLIALMTILGLLAATRILGLAMGLATSPRYGSLQLRLWEWLSGLRWYEARVVADPAFPAQLRQGYEIAWEALRAALGYPTAWGAGLTLLTLALAVGFSWLGFGLVAHPLVRWFGSSSRLGETLGALAVAQVPWLLLLVTAVPGAFVPPGLVLTALLVTQYQALRSGCRLNWGQSLAVELGATLIPALILLGAAIFAGGYGLSRIPVFDDALRLLPLLQR